MKAWYCWWPRRRVAGFLLCICVHTETESEREGESAREREREGDAESYPLCCYGVFKKAIRMQLKDQLDNSDDDVLTNADAIVGAPLDEIKHHRKLQATPPLLITVDVHTT